MSDEQLVNITYDIGPEQLDEPNPAADLPLPHGPSSWDKGPDRAGRSRLLEYGVLASIILHVLAFTVVPRLQTFQQISSPLKPEDTRTPVRLVDPPSELNKEEPPPEDFSAISDRNHTAEKQRKPKDISSLHTGPVFKNDTPQQQIASTQPPSAPEDVKKPEQPKKPRKPSKPKPKPKGPAQKDRTKPQPPIALPKMEDIKKWDVALQPTAKDLKYAFAPRGSGGSRDFFPDGRVEEAVVDINTREHRYFSYLLHVKQKIKDAWVYPSSAGRAGIGGKLLLEFVIAEDGKLKNLALLKSSGHAILDQAALAAVRIAAPYHGFPACIGAKRLRIRYTFEYVNHDGFFKSIRR